MCDQFASFQIADVNYDRAQEFMTLPSGIVRMFKRSGALPPETPDGPLRISVYKAVSVGCDHYFITHNCANPSEFKEADISDLDESKEGSEAEQETV